MVQNSGKTIRTNTFRPVNLPEPLKVEEDSSGLPLAVVRQTVVSIEDRWRIEDEWWRNEPVCRVYYAVRFASGQHLVLYQDLIQGKWYKQTY